MEDSMRFSGKVLLRFVEAKMVLVLRKSFDVKKAGAAINGGLALHNSAMLSVTYISHRPTR